MSELSEWTFFRMTLLKDTCLANQDTVHLVAKLKNKLLTPSNLIVLGKDVACASHLIHVVDKIPKALHGLTRQAVDNKDKQNYDSITLLLDKNVEICLNELNDKLTTNGIRTYLTLMRNIGDAVFNKALSPITRLHYIWRTVYFLRIWRIWLTGNGYTESEHFVTQNAYLCVEINAHMMTNTVVNIIKGRFPKDTWDFGFLTHKPVSRHFGFLDQWPLLFPLQLTNGILQRVHKLTYISAAKSAVLK